MRVKLKTNCNEEYGFVTTFLFWGFFLSIKSFCCNNIRSSMSEKDGFRIDMGMNAFRIIIIWFNLDVVNCELVSGFFHKNMNIVFFQNFRVQPD